MAYWRHTHWHKLARLLLLLVVLGQTALLLHESGHSGEHPATECQLCLHAQPHLNFSKTAPLLIANFETIAVIAAQWVQPVDFSPVYANSSRGPPRV
jgi:hypothetical protein